MNPNELAFVNQQLADRLRCGIPREGGLRQLYATMSRGPLLVAALVLGSIAKRTAYNLK